MNQSRCSVSFLAVSFLVGACAAHGQSPPQGRADLDERSVLLEWSAEKQPAAKPVTVEADTAIADVQQAEIDERIAEAMASLGRGMSEEGIVIFQQVLRVDPKNMRARFGVGTAYIQMGRSLEALEVLEPMTGEFPEDFSVKNNVAWLYATARDPSVRNGTKAIRYAQEALLLAPNSYHVWNTLSQSYFIVGEYEKARRAAEEALTLAIQANAPEASITDYRRQEEKSGRAARAMSLLD